MTVGRPSRPRDRRLKKEPTTNPILWLVRSSTCTTAICSRGINDIHSIFRSIRPWGRIHAYLLQHTPCSFPPPPIPHCAILSPIAVVSRAITILLTVLDLHWVQQRVCTMIVKYSIPLMDQLGWRIDESIDRRYVVYSMAKRERGKEEAD